MTTIQIRPLSDKPPKAGLDSEINQLLRAAQSHMGKFADKPYAMFGSELRITGALATGKLALSCPSGYPAAAMLEDYNARLFLRPAYEPIAHFFWEQMERQYPANELIKRLASCLFGRPIDYRTRGTQTTADMRSICYRYPEVNGSKSPIEQFRESALDSSVNDFETCLWRYFNFLAFHPFDDGNGRTARVLLQSDISRLVGGTFFSVPIGAVNCAWAPIYTQSVRRISTEPDKAWPDFVSLMIKIIGTAIDLTEALHENRLIVSKKNRSQRISD